MRSSTPIQFLKAPLNGHVRILLIFVFLIALTLRVEVSRHRFIYQWDEAYHALVAKNLMAHPFLPILLDHCPERHQVSWSQTRVWLHKPPWSLWCMALALKIFGIHEFCLRLPSILADLALLFLIFFFCRKHLGSAVGLLASFFWMLCPASLFLVGALRSTDHPDVWLCFFSFVFLCLMVKVLTSNVRPSLCFWLGVVYSLAVLSKGLTAVLLIVHLFLFIFARTILGRLRPHRGKRPSFQIRQYFPAVFAFTIGALLCVPWMVYTRAAFPDLSKKESEIAVQHIYMVLHGHSGGLLHHFVMLMAHMFHLTGKASGFLGLLFCAILVGYGLSSKRVFLKVLASWTIWVFVSFSIAATKMKFYCFPAYPALMILLSDMLIRIYGLRISRRSVRYVRNGALVAFFLFLCVGLLLQVRTALAFAKGNKLKGALTYHYDYDHLRKQMKRLSSDPRKGIVWNAKDNTFIQASFYSGKTVLPVLPSPEDLSAAEEKGLFNYGLFVSGSGEEKFQETEWGRKIHWIEIRPKSK